MSSTNPSGIAKATKDYMLEISEGNIPKISCVNKFGRSTNVDSGVDTDIWDGANATDDTAIWVAPTAARVHAIVSTSTDDDGDPAGDGARTVQVYGLTSWTTAETSETITLNGTGAVNTVNSYVIIHRMKVLTKGSSGPNVGVITATAASDATVTAQINAGEGQTQMAIYGIPSGVTAYMSQFYFNILRTGGATFLIDCSVLFNPEPADELLGFLTKHTTAKTSVGTSEGPPHRYIPYKPFTGPGILKLQANGSAANIDVSAGFDLILVTD